MTTAQLGDSGIVLGETDEYGVYWSWQRGSDPWQPGPAPRDVSGSLAFGHGDWSATEFYGPRSQELRVQAHAPSHEALHQARDRWMAAISLRPFRFTIAEPHVTRWATMRRRGEVPWDEQSPLIAVTSANLQGDDPRIFGEQTRTASTKFPATSGGAAWPLQWPASWDATVESGLLTLSNAGSEAADVVWRIDGPVSNPRVTDTITGEWFRLAMELLAGEWVTVNTATGEVLQSGQRGAPRRSKWAGSWLTVPPGTARAFAFGGAAGSPTASVSAEWLDTWV